MSDISKHTLIIIIISCYFLVAISQIKSDVINQTSIEKITGLDYYFFSYNVIDHNTLLVKFDITRVILFQQTHILYNADLYVSKIPTTNYKIHIGPFTGIYEKELDGTITDHFTFCLVLTPIRQQKKINNTLNQNNRTKTIFHKYLKSSYQRQQQQQQHILHYCTRMGPDENHHRHKKQGSEGDRVLLLLQIMMIGIFLVIIHVAHTKKAREFKERIGREINSHRELFSRRRHPNSSDGALQMLRFTSVIDEESENEEEEEEEDDDEEDSLTLSHRQLPSPIINRKRSRSPSPSIGPADDHKNNSSIEHILDTKPWLQIPQ